MKRPVNLSWSRKYKGQGYIRMHDMSFDDISDALIHLDVLERTGRFVKDAVSVERWRKRLSEEVAWRKEKLPNIKSIKRCKSIW